MIQIAAEIHATDWVPVLVQSLITIGAVFGGAGFWQYKQAQLQAKRDSESKKTGVESKVDTLTANLNKLTAKVDDLTSNISEIQNDIELLQLANEETINYRQARDAADNVALQEHKAVVAALRGIMRDRLLAVYTKCIKKGYYTQEERETYGELFSCYESHPFNGNGVMHQLRPIMQALPWTAEEAGVLNDDDSKE